MMQNNLMRDDFWPSCGYQTLTIDEDNRLSVSDDFLRFFFARPELAPIDESCAAEKALHAQLLNQPGIAVSAADLMPIADSDTRENYQFALAFRDLLLQSQTLEKAYLNLTGGRFRQPIPPVLVDWLVQLILKHILWRGNTAGDDAAMPTPSAYQLRAAELFFRRQKADLSGGILLADADWLQRHSRPRQAQGITLIESLIQQAGGIVADAQETMIETLSDDNCEKYWAHSETYQLALDFGFKQTGIQAFMQVLALWLHHFHGITGHFTALREIQDDRWRWHIGLDTESNAILNKLYHGSNLDDAERNRLLVLLRLDIEPYAALQPELQGYPIYLALALDENSELRLKPQNLLLNLPLAAPI